jgi:hypothetical protein
MFEESSIVLSNVAIKLVAYSRYGVGETGLRFRSFHVNQYRQNPIVSCQSRFAEAHYYRSVGV